ncbi:MAG TPA: FxLYD domain-containing protein [Propionicimonas sp.]|jgi:hypothetical protein
MWLTHRSDFAAHDAAGTVLGTASDSTISPSRSDRLVVTDISVPEGAVVAKVDAQVTVSESQPDKHPDIAMIASKVAILADKYSTMVTGTIDSTYSQSVTYVWVTAVCTDAAGKVVAAGYTYMDGKVVPGTSTPFSLDVTASSTPSACKVSAGVTNLSKGADSTQAKPRPTWLDAGHQLGGRALRPRPRCSPRTARPAWARPTAR